jgi:hypothetical protein
MPIVIRTACAVLIAFLAAGVGAAAQTSVKGPVTFFDFIFPEEIAGAQRINVHDYEATEPGLGYSASYRQGEMTATVYIYDDGKPFIPDDPQSLLVVEQLEQSRTETLRLWQDVGAKVNGEERFVMEDARGRTRLICTGFALIGNEGPVSDTFACLGVAKNKFLKFRVSIIHHKGSQAEAKRFISAWINRLWPSA